MHIFSQRAFFICNPLILAFAVWLLIITGCTHHPSHTHPQRSTPALSSPSSVEQQLLATVKQAESLPPGNPLLPSSLYSLATYYEDQKEFDKSAIQYQRVLVLKEDQIGPNHPDLAMILKRYAQVLHSEAQSVTARANAILKNSSVKSPNR